MRGGIREAGSGNGNENENENENGRVDCWSTALPSARDSRLTVDSTQSTLPNRPCRAPNKNAGTGPAFSWMQRVNLSA
ncbi:hypothetical protein D7Y61_08385 [Stenotrophomonas maltophilia]|nr:hypothetical protein [Stenotrophomonas maltophilia]